MDNKNGHLVLFCLKAYLKGKGAGFWSKELGWVTEKDATRFTEEEASTCQPPGGHATWMRPPSEVGLRGYQFCSTDPGSEIRQIKAVFWARSVDHARQQAQMLAPLAKTREWRVVSVDGVPVTKGAKTRKRASIAGRQIFLITKTGPEWQDHIEAWSNKKQAKKRADELNSTLDPNDSYDCLSLYGVVPVTLLGG